MPNQATAFDHTFYDIFVPQKVPLSKIFDDVLHVIFGLALPPIKNPGCANAQGGFLGRSPPKLLLVPTKRE